MREEIEVLRQAKPGRDAGFVVSIVDATGERTFLTSRGAEASLTAADLDPVRPAPGDAVYLSGYGLAHPSNAAALLGWLGRLGEGHVVVFDPARSPVPAGSCAGPGAGACGLVDLQRQGGRPAHRGGDPGDALQALTDRLPRAGVLVRVGPDGCLLGRRGFGAEHVPGFGVEAVDTNGAGDTHTGAFLAALASGAPAVDAVRRANGAAALSVTRRGPATGPSRAELDAFLS